MYYVPTFTRSTSYSFAYILHKAKWEKASAGQELIFRVII